MGDDWVHAAGCGQGERLAVMDAAALGIESVGVGCNVAANSSLLSPNRAGCISSTNS
jgi:hypothetical protein